MPRKNSFIACGVGGCEGYRTLGVPGTRPRKEGGRRAQSELAAAAKHHGVQDAWEYTTTGKEQRVSAISELAQL